MTLEEQYIQMLQVVKESRDLLASKLYNFRIISEEQYLESPFYDLLQCIDPEEIHAHTILNLPNEPIENESLPHIQSKAELSNYLYAENGKPKIVTKDLSLVDLNYILLKKTLFYREYLKYHLRNMNINEELLRSTNTIKGLIKLLDYVDRKRYTSIEISVDDILYYQIKNEIIISIIDDIGNYVTKGEVEVYLNGIFYQSYDVAKPCYIIPWQLGTNTIKIKYVNNDKYFASETEEISFTVEVGALVPSIKLKNTNPDSYYYDIDYGETDLIEGYSYDTWDLDVIITNLQGKSVNTAVPFKIYLEDKEHILIDSTTENDGLKRFTNITIPYHNSDFINMREREIESISTLEQPIEYSSDEILENLEFVTDFYIEDDMLTFETKKFSPNDFLYDLNGCISNIHLDEGYIVWDEFQTDRQIKIEYLDNVKAEIGQLVTNLIYFNHILYIETAEKQQISIVYVPRREYLNLYIETNLNSDIYDDDYAVYRIGLYYPALDIDDNLLSWYKDTPTQPSKIPIRMIDMYTGELQEENSHKLITISVEGESATKDYFNTSIYNLIPSNNLPYGEKKFNINICTNTPSYISQKINWENATTISFYYKSKEFGILHVYIGNIKIGILTAQKEWTLFTYNNIQNLFTNDTNYQQQLRIINIISFTNVYVDDITIDNSNLINGNFEEELLGWTSKGGVSYAEKGRNNSICVDFLNTKQCNNISKFFNIKSNFEIPSDTIFYQNNTPDIYYKPLGQIEANKRVILYTPTTQYFLYTNEDGLLEEFKNKKAIGIYDVNIRGGSDNVSELRVFSYQIKKPFDIIDVTSDSVKEAKYQIKIYDLKHPYNIQLLHNNVDISSVYQIIGKMTENDIITINIVIPRNEYTTGQNTLKVTMNDYSESVSFDIIVPEISCITDVKFDNNKDLIVTTINRSEINNTNIVTNIELNADKDLKLTTKNIQYPHNSVKNVLTDVFIENKNLCFTTYDEDD